LKLSAPLLGWRSLFPGPPSRRRLAQAVCGTAGLIMLAFFLAGAPLPWAAAGLLASGLLLTTLIEPAVALCVLAFAIPFGSLGPQFMDGVNLVDALVALVALASLARAIAGRQAARAATRQRFQAPPLTWHLLIFVWVLGLSLTQALSWRLGLSEWLKWGEFALLYLVASQFLSRRQIGWVVAALFAAGLLEAGLGAYQFLRQVGPKEFVLMGRFMRAYGTFNQPNPYAGYLGYLVPVAASLALGGLGRWWQRRQWHDFWLGLACALVALLLTVGIGMSWSRGSWLGLGAALAVVICLRSKRAAPIVAVGFIAVAVGLAVLGTSWLPASVAQRLSDLDLYAANVDLGRVEVTDDNFAVLERLGHWQAGAAMFSDHPWLGVGIGNYAVAYPAYAPPHFYDPLGHAHNIYLNFLAETGVLGGTAFVALWLAAFWLAWRTARSTAGNDAALALGVLGTLTYLTVHNLFDNVFVAHMQLQLAVLLAALVALRRQHPHTFEIAARHAAPRGEKSRTSQS